MLTKNVPNNSCHFTVLQLRSKYSIRTLYVVHLPNN